MIANEKIGAMQPAEQGMNQGWVSADKGLQLNTSPKISWGWGVKAVGGFRYGLLVLGVVSQIATVAITWPLWQVRDYPPALPVRWWPMEWMYHGNLGWAMVASALLALLLPRGGVWVHGLVLGAGCLADEMRTQPQFAAIWLLMIGVVEGWGAPLARWFLIAMWGWAGFHKLASPEWLTSAAWWVYQRLPVHPEALFEIFSYGLGVIELGAAVLALWRPRAAAWLCAVMHLGIAVGLTPLGMNWNYSVLPWNLCSAVIGSWLLATTPPQYWRQPIEWMWGGVFLIYPIGFYGGWIDHGLAFVLYSQHYPRGFICTPERSFEIKGWGQLNVPFPNERRTLKGYFRFTGEAGDKLHLHDPRSSLPDEYWESEGRDSMREITLEEFSQVNPQGVRGEFFDDVVAAYYLERAGVAMLRRKNRGSITAVQFTADNYRPELLKYVRRLENVELLQLAGTRVVDADLQSLAGHPRLRGLGLDDTAITDRVLPWLQQLPQLELVEHRGTTLTPELLESETSALSQQ